jgi:hypothetical protein
MKLKQHQFSIQPRIFEGSTYSHPWYQHIAKENGCARKSDKAIPVLIRPNPPSKEAVERAKFVDKTYEWRGRPSNIRSGN